MARATATRRSGLATLRPERVPIIGLCCSTSPNFHSATRAGVVSSLTVPANALGSVLNVSFALALVTATVVPASAEPSNAPPVLDTRFGIAEGFRNPGAMADIGAGWERLILPWNQIQPDAPGDFSNLGHTVTKAADPERAESRNPRRGASAIHAQLGRHQPERRRARRPAQPGPALRRPRQLLRPVRLSDGEVLLRPDRPVDHLERARVQAERPWSGRQLTRG